MYNTYKQITYTDGTTAWGAHINLGRDREPVKGDEITVTTKAGEKQARIVKRIVKRYSGTTMLAELYADEQVAAQTQKRYEAVTAKKASTYGTTLCPLCQSYCDGDCTAANNR